MAGFSPDPDRFIAFDCSGTTGWAWGDSERLHKSGIWKMPKEVRKSAALNRFRQWSTEMIVVNRCGRVYFEAPIMPHARAEIDSRGKAHVMQNTSLEAVTALVGYAVILGVVCDDLGIECYPIAMQTWRSEFGVPVLCPPSVKKHLKGADAGRKWTKEQTAIKVRALGHVPATDDESDAIGMFEAIRGRRARRLAQPGLGLFDDEVAP
jgi:hypothetical protein